MSSSERLNTPSFKALLEDIQTLGGFDALKSLKPPTQTAAPPKEEEEPPSSDPGWIMNPIIYLAMDIQILPNVPEPGFYALAMKTEDGFLEGSGIGYGPEVTRGGALRRGSITYNARPGEDAFLPPNKVTFEWVVGKPVGVDEDPDLCVCEAFVEGKKVLTLGGWAEGFGALVGTRGIMHWVKKEVDESD